MIPKKYLPQKLSKKDYNVQRKALIQSKSDYMQGVYKTRPQLKSYTSKTSKHVTRAKKLYNIDSVTPSRKLVTKTGCSMNALHAIIKKGQGAYYSGGSRPSQTASSWGHARLASALTGGKSAAVDYKILNAGCKPKSKALMLAKAAKKKHGYGQRRVPKVTLKEI